MATDEENSRNEITYHWTNDEIGVALQSWLWVSVELMAYVSEAIAINHKCAQMHELPWGHWRIFNNQESTFENKVEINEWCYYKH